MHLHAVFDYDDRVYVQAIVDRLAAACIQYCDARNMSRDCLEVCEADAFDAPPYVNRAFCIMYNNRYNRIHVVCDSRYYDAAFLFECGAILCFGKDAKLKEAPARACWPALCVARFLINDAWNSVWGNLTNFKINLDKFSYRCSLGHLRANAILSGARIKDLKHGIKKGINNRAIIIHYVIKDILYRSKLDYVRACVPFVFVAPAHDAPKLGAIYLDFYKSTSVEETHNQIMARQYHVTATYELNDICRMPAHVLLVMAHYTSRGNEPDRVRRARMKCGADSICPAFAYAVTVDQRVHVGGWGEKHAT